jgi:hypothetical protein
MQEIIGFFALLVFFYHFQIVAQTSISLKGGDFLWANRIGKKEVI